MPEILGYQAPTGLEMPKFNASHKLVSLKFGPDMKGASYPLDGTVKVAKDGAQTAFDYYLQLVPSRYLHLNGARTDTNQYSVTEFDQKAGTYNGQIVPASVLFKWDFSPIMVTVKETRRGFLQFVTSLCAIIGGVFAVAGVINSGIFRTSQLLQAAPRKIPRSDD
jgi:endoplasmic reticulum-Golgi intermediate compartment protein 3